MEESRSISKRGKDKTLPSYCLFRFDVDGKYFIYKSATLGQNVVVGGKYEVKNEWDARAKEKLKSLVLGIGGKF